MKGKDKMKENQNNQFGNKVREFLTDLAKNEIIQGKEYHIRFDINDGGDNSYIGLNIWTEDFRREKPVTRDLRIFRNSNSVSHLPKTWEFELGGVCHAYADNPDVPIRFESYQ